MYGVMSNDVMKGLVINMNHLRLRFEFVGKVLIVDLLGHVLYKWRS